MTVETPHGPARVHLHPVDRPRAALMLGHGAGGGVTAPDLVAATEAAQAAELSVALVEQPYRVAGRRSPAPAHQLDAAWIAVVEQLRADALAGLPLIVRRTLVRRPRRLPHGRARPARSAVLCLAFPRPPARATRRRRACDELDAVTVPMLVVQGERDPFGMPPDGGRTAPSSACPATTPCAASPRSGRP